MKKTIALTAAMLAALAAPTLAADLSGEWLRDTGASRGAFAPCGDSLCGTITWLAHSDTPAKVGQQVFFDMKPAGENEWTVQAFNPEDGKTYSGKMRLNGNTLVTEGCVFVICKSSTWTRM